MKVLTPGVFENTISSLTALDVSAQNTVWSGACRDNDHLYEVNSPTRR